MNDYGRGSVLSAAITLPATSGALIFLTEKTHPLVIWGYLLVCIISVVVLLYYLVNFLINRKGF